MTNAPVIGRPLPGYGGVRMPNTRPTDRPDRPVPGVQTATPPRR